MNPLFSKIAHAHTFPPLLGVIIGIFIIFAWAITLIFNFLLPASLTDPWVYMRILLQAHLFTGLFITAHDAMHGAVHPKRPKINHFLGKLSATLFLFNEYKKLRPKHYEHHKYVATDHDPDFHNGNPNFFRWYFDFLTEYISFKQIVLAAITYNILKWGFGIAELNLILFWVIPSFLSTFQLFYFGTYIPHKGEHEHDNHHRSRSQHKNHIWAFISCYFFGYHYEHHDKPNTPWWQLWQLKA